MRDKIRKILLETLVSQYDQGNIEDGGIIGGDEAIDQLYSLVEQEIKDG